ncbi:MAG: FAD-dependent monooxygenase [Planctomycetota bacterium]
MTEAPETHVDVLVAGAGPAGLAAARAAALAGARVLVADAKREIGLPVRCAEFVPRLMAREVEVPEGAVAQTVEGIVVSVADGRGGARELGRIRSPGFILHRERLEARLAEIAVEAGAELVMRTRAGPSGGGLVRLVGDGGGGERHERRVRARAVVAADGPSSAFRPDRGPRRALPAVQVTLPLERESAWTEVRFSREVRFGYAWVFPKGDFANVGLGCEPEGGRRVLLPLLESFVAELRAEGTVGGGAPARRTAGWIPVWGPPETAAGELAGAPVLLAGDAAGFTDPVTGAGIWQAIATGRMAGECAARSAAGDSSAPPAYDCQWRGIFHDWLARSAAARVRLERDWDARDLEQVVRDAWPGL